MWVYGDRCGECGGADGGVGLMGRDGGGCGVDCGGFDDGWVCCEGVFW